MGRNDAKTQRWLPNAFALRSSDWRLCGMPGRGRPPGTMCDACRRRKLSAAHCQRQGHLAAAAGAANAAAAQPVPPGARCAHTSHGVPRRGTRAATACEQPHVAATARIARSCRENTPQRGAATLSGGRGRVHRRAEPGRRCSRATAASEQSDVAAAARNARGRQDRAHLLRCESTLQGWAAAQGCGRGLFRAEPLQLAGCQRDACSGSSSLFGPSPAWTSRGRHWWRCNAPAEA